MSLKSDYYKNLLLSISRGNHRGIFSNAKPFFLIALCDAIRERYVLGNVIRFDNHHLKSLYIEISSHYSSTITPFSKPFFHLNSEPFYYIKFRLNVEPPKQAKTPSSKFLREHIEYAALDDDLWDLLQDKEIRDEYRQAIINHFIKR